MKTYIYVSIVVLFFSCSQKAVVEKEIRNKPIIDLVPNENTALKIAEAVWYPIYGDRIYESKPFKAKDIDNRYWYVEGTLNYDKGGVPYVQIQKLDGKIIKIGHSK